MREGGLRLRAPQDAAAGLFLIGLAAFAFWQTSDLSLGTMRQLGPGMLPRILTFATGLCGLVILINAFLHAGAGLERWSLRGPLFVLGAAVAFGLTIRPLGLAVAGPLVIIISSFADPGSRIVQTAVFSIVMTAFCIGLFKLLLSLPVPVAPWLLGY